MPDYRLYRLGKDGHIQGPPEVVTCEDDDAALLKAQRYVSSCAIEIWANARRVGFIPSDD